MEGQLGFVELAVVNAETERVLALAHVGQAETAAVIVGRALATSAALRIWRGLLELDDVEPGRRIEIETVIRESALEGRK